MTQEEIYKEAATKTCLVCGAVFEDKKIRESGFSKRGRPRLRCYECAPPCRKIIYSKIKEAEVIDE
jgi:hypothetical protein